jgi:CYTH domain-containing protein
MDHDLQGLGALNQGYVRSAEISDVRVRIIGEVAIIHAGVAAHFTRI